MKKQQICEDGRNSGSEWHWPESGGSFNIVIASHKSCACNKAIIGQNEQIDKISTALWSILCLKSEASTSVPSSAIVELCSGPEYSSRFMRTSRSLGQLPAETDTKCPDISSTTRAVVTMRSLDKVNFLRCASMFVWEFQSDANFDATSLQHQLCP